MMLKMSCYPKSPFWRSQLVESQLIKGNTTVCFNPWLSQAPTITTYRVNLLKTTVKSFKKRLINLLNDKYDAPPKVYEIPGLPEMVCIAKSSHSSHLENSDDKEVIVDSCCGAALLRGAHIFAPGVLAMESGTRTGDIVRVYADLAGECKKGTNKRYESAHKFFLGVGVAHMQRHQLYQTSQPEGIAIEMKATISGVPSLGNLSEHFGGDYVLLQNLPSIVCVRVLNPQAGDHVLDMCASPGNKTTHIAEMMRDEGVIVALDKTERKIEHVRAKIKANNLNCIRPFAFDATKAYNATNIPNEYPDDSWAPPFTAQKFDRILLDAPCSALGNRPILSSQMTPKMLQSYPHVQRKLFENAVPLLRTNGVLVYSTCTVTSAENESMVAWALQKFPNIQLVDATPRFGFHGLPHLDLTEEEIQLVQRFGPATSQATEVIIDTVGFFIAKFIKSY